MTETIESLPLFARYASTLIFVFAIVHTFSVKYFAAWAAKHPEGSVQENILHLLSEVEIVFGLWAGVFVAFLAIALSPRDAIHYLEGRNYTEPLFVFVIMTVCATRPILILVESALGLFKSDLAAFVAIMVLGPLLGSLITEPAAMTVCALILLRRFYLRSSDLRFKYAMTGLLFVNISVGGTLTSFAAPPVLMVAGAWNWNSTFMFLNFGWKAIVACVASTALITYLFRNSIRELSLQASESRAEYMPLWLSAVHIVFAGLIISLAHHPIAFVGAFLFFIGVTTVTKEYQQPLKLNEGLLVGFFLAGLVVLGGPQGWWLETVLLKLERLLLFLSAMGLTALVDNAALTYLGTLVPTLSDGSKYALLAGAVVGGGLTVIANAPNPAGYGILKGAAVFGEGGMSPIRLLRSALLPTSIAALCFWFF